MGGFTDAERSGVRRFADGAASPGIACGVGAAARLRSTRASAGQAPRDRRSRRARRADGRTHHRLVCHHLARVRRQEPVFVRYGRRADLSDAEVSEPFTPHAARDHTVHLLSTGWPPTAATTTRWTRLLEPALEGVGVASFRTAPAEPADFDCRVRLVHVPGIPSSGVGRVLAAQPSLFLTIGDHHYGDTTDVGDLRRAYRASRAVDGFARLAMTTPMLGMWDDSRLLRKQHGRPRRQQAQRAAGVRRVLGQPAASRGRSAGHGFKASWGGVDFFVLDLRYWRTWTGRCCGQHQRECFSKGCPGPPRPSRSS